MHARRSERPQDDLCNGNLKNGLSRKKFLSRQKHARLCEDPVADCTQQPAANHGCKRANLTPSRYDKIFHMCNKPMAIYRVASVHLTRLLVIIALRNAAPRAIKHRKRARAFARIFGGYFLRIAEIK